MKRHAAIGLILVLFAPLGQAMAKNNMTSPHLFRTPYSLNESLHDGLLAIQARLQGLAADQQDCVPLLTQIGSDVEALHAEFDHMIDQSNIHRVHRGDREYLQSVIDRIDQLIEALEAKRSQLQTAAPETSGSDFEAAKAHVLKVLEQLRSTLNA